MKRYEQVRRFVTSQDRPSGLFMMTLGFATFVARPPEPGIWTTIQLGLAWIVSIGFLGYLVLWLFFQMQRRDDD